MSIPPKSHFYHTIAKSSYKKNNPCLLHILHLHPPTFLPQIPTFLTCLPGAPHIKIVSAWDTIFIKRKFIFVLLFFFLLSPSVHSSFVFRGTFIPQSHLNLFHCTFHCGVFFTVAFYFPPLGFSPTYLALPFSLDFYFLFPLPSLF